MHLVGRRSLLRAVALPLVLLAAAVLLAGCVRVRADLSVSEDYKVSGTVVAASIPTSPADRGPQLAIPADLGDQVVIQPYSADGYVGTQLSFNGLELDEFNTLADSSSPVRGSYALSLRRIGDLVVFSGSVDLTRLPADHADVRISVGFPSDVNGATGTVTGDTVDWQLKPGAVGTLAATSDLSTLANAEWIRWAVLVAALLGITVLAVGGLAVLAHRRSVRARLSRVRSR